MRLPAVSIFLFVLIASFNVHATAKSLSISTEDGLKFSFNEKGEIIDLRVGGKNILDRPLQPFWIRDLTPDYEIDNLIYNPSFEIDEDADNLPDGWNVTIHGEAEVVIDRNDTNSGNCSLRIFAHASKKSCVVTCESGFVPIEEGKEYCLSAYVKNDFGFLEEGWSTSMQISCVFYDGMDRELSVEKLNVNHTLYSWKRISKLVHAPPGAEKARIILSYTGPKINTVPGMSNNTAWFDDVIFYELPQKAEMREIEGGMEENGGKLTFSGYLDDFDLMAVYEAKEDYIEISGEVSSEGEKSFDLYFLLPVDALGWRWWDDIRNYREIGEGIYWFVVNADESGYLPLSPYPFGVITKDVAISIAVPVLEPRTFRIFYDSNNKEFGISFSFATTPSRKANFTIYIYRCDPEWSFRDALNRYYQLFPESFQGEIDLKFLNASWEYSDFGIRAVQGFFFYDKQAREVPELNSENVYVAQYILPTEIGVKSLCGINEPCPSYEDFISLLDYYALEGNHFIKAKSAASINSTLRDINGDIIMGKIIRGPNWAPDAWVARIPLNTDPDIPGCNIANMLIDSVREALNLTASYGGSIDGIEIDNFMRMCRFIDTNRSRFQYTDYPLVYSPNNFEPGVHGMMSMVEYLKELKRNFPELKLTGNCVEMGLATFGFPYLDALPFEVASVTGWNFGDKDLNYRRCMAYHRYVAAHECSKLYDNIGRVKMQQLWEYVNKSLFYGIYPLLKDDFFENCNYNLARPVYKKIIPIIDELFLAGWEPITYAKTNNGVWIERFGKGSNIYFTVRNEENYTKEYTIEINSTALNLGDDVFIMEMLSNEEVSYETASGKILIEDSIPAKGTKVFKLSEEQVLSIEILKPKEGYLHLLGKPILHVGRTIIVGRTSVNVKVCSGEDVERLEFYVDNELKFTDFDEPFSWEWNEPSFGYKEIAVIAFDRNGNSASASMGAIVFIL